MLPFTRPTLLSNSGVRRCVPTSDVSLCKPCALCASVVSDAVMHRPGAAQNNAANRPCTGLVLAPFRGSGL